MEGTGKERKPGIGVSAGVFLGILLVLSVGIAVFKMDVISLLVLCLIGVSGISMYLGYTMDELFDAMAVSLKNAAVSLLSLIHI